MSSSLKGSEKIGVELPPLYKSMAAAICFFNKLLILSSWSITCCLTKSKEQAGKTKRNAIHWCLHSGKSRRCFQANKLLESQLKNHEKRKISLTDGQKNRPCSCWLRKKETPFYSKTLKTSDKQKQKQIETGRGRWPKTFKKKGKKLSDRKEKQSKKWNWSHTNLSLSLFGSRVSSTSRGISLYIHAQAWGRGSVLISDSSQALTTVFIHSVLHWQTLL